MSKNNKILLGVDYLKSQLHYIPQKPGIYKMLDEKGDILYVGKAKKLRNRVQNYTQFNGLTTRIKRMVQRARKLEFVITDTEAEALLLEANLIKTIRPPYNILLKDDKSYPYITLEISKKWPRMTKFRGKKNKKDVYFGPFASVGFVNDTIVTLEKAFLLRSCSDHEFKNRKRPCMLYQIKRCSAPCVGHIDHDDYSEYVKQAADYLKGKSHKVQESLIQKMNDYAAHEDYEHAAIYRDRIKALTSLQNKQDINLTGLGDADVIAMTDMGGYVGFQWFFYRAGQHIGQRLLTPRRFDMEGEKLEDVFAACLAQYYSHHKAPPTLIISHDINFYPMMQEALSMHAGHQVKITRPQRGYKKDLLKHALDNGKIALDKYLLEHEKNKEFLAMLVDHFHLPTPISRLDVFDNSHLFGKNAYGAMIVASEDGFDKKEYRLFKVKSKVDQDQGQDTQENADKSGIRGGDDYYMMQQVMERRFKRLMNEDPDRSKGMWPGALIIDGGKGQITMVQKVLDELGIKQMPVIGVSKGPDRNAGREEFYMKNMESFSLKPAHPLLHFIQRIRDEAHRFAITSHRQSRSKNIRKSLLDQIDGVGASRKKALIQHFGSVHGVKAAHYKDLAKVPGISLSLAKKIYDFFHEE